MNEKLDVHGWFELTYAAYLTLPRSILQSMPEDWQHKFVTLLNELDEEAMLRNIETPRYTVMARNGNGKFIFDPFRSYERGRRDVFAEYPKLLPPPQSGERE